MTNEVTHDHDLLGAIWQVCPCGLLLLDGAGRIARANPELERCFGYAVGELNGVGVDALVPGLLRALGSKGAYGGWRLGEGREWKAARRDGAELWVEVALAALPGSGRARCLLLVADVSERKQRERALEERVTALECSNADLEQFASIASHDLREPLRMVVSYTQLLAERYRGQIDDKADKFIRYAVEGALRMQRLIDDLLAYSRLESPGRLSVPTSLTDALRDTLSDMSVLLRDTGADVTHGELPEVRADPAQLQRLLQNLIHNAIKFRREEPPRVRITAEREGDMWRVEVADNGIGIEPRYSERIFQMFQRLHERGKFDGNGIGLATARKIVERHGGKIGVESTPGQGSTFFFTLPAC